MRILLIVLVVTLCVTGLAPIVVGACLGSELGEPSVPRAAELLYQAILAAVTVSIFTVVAALILRRGKTRSILRALANDVVIVMERASLYLAQAKINAISKSYLMPAHEWSRLPEVCAEIGDAALSEALFDFYEKVWRAEACFERSFQAISDKGELMRGRDLLLAAAKDRPLDRRAEELLGSFVQKGMVDKAARQSHITQAVTLDGKAKARVAAADEAKQTGMAFLFPKAPGLDVASRGLEIVSSIQKELRESKDWSILVRAEKTFPKLKRQLEDEQEAAAFDRLADEDNGKAAP